jgi:AcrR family transcriptional regulator
MVVAQRLTAEDWARAALAAIGERGLAGVAVEPLATRLGTTKGSFYWHFTNRDALVVAALELWERTYTDDVFRAVETAGGPEERLRALFGAVTRSELAPVEVNLHAAADNPLLAPAVRRAVDRRTAWVADRLRELGCTPADADRRALLAYSTWLGHVQLAVRMPEVLPHDHGAYLDTIFDAVIGRQPSRKP